MAPISGLSNKPTPSYFEDLLLYRNISTENDITAEHIGSLLRDHVRARLLDLGCGDASLTNKVGWSLAKSLELRAIDIDPFMTEIAEASCLRDKAFSKCDVITGDIVDHLPGIWGGVDAAIMVHVNYFLSDKAFVSILDSLPAGVKFAFVTDKEDSVFSKLWQRTAYNYYERARFGNRCVLERRDLHVSKSVIRSTIKCPLRFQGTNDRDRLLSFLAYSDVRQLPAAEKKWIEEIIEQYTTRDKLLIETNCYLITKRDL